jgi:hypothetical protein
VLLSILDPGSKNNKKEEGGRISCLTFFSVVIFTKSIYFLFLNRYRKIEVKELKYFLPKKLLPSYQKYWLDIRDPGTDIRVLEKNYPGS